MIEALDLTHTEIFALGGICFIAGLVRGFSGFALSALVMASAVIFLAPIELIPILWFLEMAASLLMARGGWKDADRESALTLVGGNMLGWPIGLWMTTSVSGSSPSARTLFTSKLFPTTDTPSAINWDKLR